MSLELDHSIRRTKLRNNVRLTSLPPSSLLLPSYSKRVVGFPRWGRGAATQAARTGRRTTRTSTIRASSSRVAADAFNGRCARHRRDGRRRTSECSGRLRAVCGPYAGAPGAVRPIRGQVILSVSKKGTGPNCESLGLPSNRAMRRLSGYRAELRRQEGVALHRKNAPPGPALDHGECAIVPA